MEKILVNGQFEIREILNENDCSYDKVVTLINRDKIYKKGPKEVARYFNQRSVLVIYQSACKSS